MRSLGVRIALLGPLLVVGDDGQSIPVAGARLRTLVIRLALDARRPVNADALIDAVWGDDITSDTMAGSRNALQTLVSRLRRILPADAITAVTIGDATGYRIDATVDIDEFDQLARASNAAADATTARARLGEALALWRGPALVDVADADFARAAVVRLDEARLAVLDAWFGARTTLEPPSAILGELESHAAAHPLREQPHAALIAALAAAGRQADAVDVYERLRSRLADELGLDPSPELTSVYTSMLRGERFGNLRPALTSFVGRDPELARLTALIREHRLVTLVGPGGAGKTRLASEAVRAMAADFAGGVWFVELAPVRDPDDVARALVDALQLRELRFLDLHAPARALDRVLSALETKDLLLVLDNCEHLIDASARLVDAILRSCEGVRIVTTSREPLAITGEALCPVGPLATPGSTGDIREVASVRLFVDRAVVVKPGFALSDANVGAVAEICRRLDGMPLAIELACARLRTLPVDQIAVRLDDRFRLLTGGSRTALPRHQTLLAVVEWSWDLLSEAERLLAKQFSVFLDGATVDTITGIAGSGGVGTSEVDALSGLVDKSFVTLGDDGRYRMLETIRAYAAERLADAGEAATARDRHAHYFMTMATYADEHIRGLEQARWLRWLSDERDNLGGALRWAIDSGDAPTAVQLSGALGWFWLVCDFHAEAQSGLGQSLAMPGDVSDEARAVALSHYAINQMVYGYQDAAFETMDAARKLNSQHPVVALSQVMAPLFGNDPSLAEKDLPKLLNHPDPWIRAMGGTVAGLVAIFAGDPDAAERELRAAVVAFETIGDLWARATIGSLLGEIRGLRGDRVGAIAALQSSAAIAEELGVPDVAAQMYLSLSLHRARTGDLAGANADLDRARRRASSGVAPQMMTQLLVADAEITRRTGDLALAQARYRDALVLADSVKGLASETRGGLLMGYAFTVVALGDVEQAHRFGSEIVDAATPASDRISLSMAAAVFASVAYGKGDATEAAYFIGVADAIRGVPDAGNPDLAGIVEWGRAQLGVAGYERAYATGCSLDQAGAVTALKAAAAKAR
jgi:predicted ATPase/DNA-binding SARP family transcriptional activator